ncbi:hypothetical protein, conserved [Trypanosoma cruzi]|uniref:C2 domain-containing protein n=1 Tax=Trypanosoma cruzi (strain CL Brener) TaxID=353153 RepID=Q4D770_TRYCC|nr:hypothetical protein, conserved [Trypanosoma cruzi]EAN88376.1 hypothetical protein, conserved [Trypanosoma cruzi]|eukprot:XP_810227.1 hypothetical protein [Trypanosoma cruzi strain CL Brener]
MSIFGEPLPHEDDTATSLIRREGYPPLGSYDQMPQVYVCPCCSAINPSHERDHLLRTAKEEKELERRRIMQLDIFDERAKPISTAAPRPRSINIHHDPEDDELNQPVVPPPPMTLDELRKLRQEANKTRLIVTVHHGKNLQADPHDPTSILVRCGAFEGQTAKVPRGTGTICTWEELFEFPYPNEEEPLEVLVIDDELPADQDHILGGIVVPPYALRNRARGDEDVLPVCREGEMHRGYGRMKETPLGSIVVSWYVKYDGQETEPTDGKQNLESPVDCVFVVHRIFQYTDNGTTPFTGGVLCVLRDTDDNCSASTQYQPSGVANMSTSPYYTKEGFNYLPEPSSQIMQLITEKRLGHVLVCVPKSDEEGEENEELLVVGAVPLDFGELYRKGSAVLLVESKVKEDVLWGEIALEWCFTPHADVQRKLEELQLAEESKLEHEALEDKEMPPTSGSLFVTVVRGLNLTNCDGRPLTRAQVSVFSGDMEGSTFVAPREVGEDGLTNVMNWNQEVRFIDLDGDPSEITVYVIDEDQRVSSGAFAVEQDRGYAVVKMHDPYDEEKQMGELLVTYNRHCTAEDAAAKVSGIQNGEANKVNGNGTRRISTKEGSERSPGSRSHRYSNDDICERDNESEDNINALEGYEYDDMHKGGKKHSDEEQSRSRSRNRSYPEEKEDSRRERSGREGRERGYPEEKEDSRRERSGREGRERGYPEEKEDSRRERSGREGRERGYPEEKEDSRRERSGREGRERGYPEEKEDSRRERSGREGRERGYPEEKEDSRRERSGSEGRKRTYPEEKEDSRRERSGREGRERSYPEEKEDSRRERSGREGRERGYPEEKEDSRRERSGREGRERSYPEEKEDSRREQSGSEGRKRTYPEEKEDSRREQSGSEGRKRTYPEEKEDSRRERSGREGRERGYPEEKEDSRREQSGSEGRKRTYPEEREDARRGRDHPEEGLRNAGAGDNIPGDVVGRESGKREPVQNERSREEDEPNYYGGYPQEYLSERVLKSGHDENEKQEEMEGQDVAASSKPPRAVRTTLLEDKHRSSRGASPPNGPASASVPSQPHSTPHSDWSQGDTGFEPRGGKTKVGKSPSRPEQFSVPKVPTVRQPWFPAGSTGNEDHIPLEKRESFINRTDSIRDLERRSRVSEKSSGRHVSRQSTTHD